MSSKNVVDSFREVVQDLLVPELKALKVTVEALRADTKLTTDAIRQEMKLANESLREEIRLRHEILERSLRASDLHTEQLVRALADKLDFTMEMRERLASIEARMPKQ